MFNESQVKAISAELRQRYEQGTIPSHVVVVSLIALVKAERITIEQVKPILLEVLDGELDVLVALKKADTLIDKDMVDSIIKDMKGTPS